MSSRYFNETYGRVREREEWSQPLPIVKYNYFETTLNEYLIAKTRQNVSNSKRFNAFPQC